MTRRSCPPVRTVKPKQTKTSAQLMAEDTLRELIAVRFAVGKPVIHVDANWKGFCAHFPEKCHRMSKKPLLSCC